MDTVLFTRGGTFSLAGLISLPAGVWTAASDIKTRHNVLIEHLVCTLTDTNELDISGNSIYSLLLESSYLDTGNWPIGFAYCDVQFTGNEQRLYSEMFQVDIKEAITV